MAVIPPSPTQAPAQLPRVNLRGKVIASRAIHRIPQEVAEKYQVVCFEETATSLRLAIVYPEQLKQGFYVAIKDLGTKLGRSIELFQTDAASLKIALKQYAQVAPTSKAATATEPEMVGTSVHPPYPKPPLFEIGRSVAFSYLRRVPVDFCKVHRVMCVDFVKPDLFWFVVDRAAGSNAIKTLQQLEQHNELRIVPLPIATQEFDELLAYYEAREKERQAELVEKVLTKKPAAPEVAPVVEAPAREEVAAQVIAQTHAEQELAPEPKKELASDVLEPDAQAAIITTEEERGGIAGLLQRITQTSVASKAAPVASLEAGQIELAVTAKEEARVEEEKHPTPAPPVQQAPAVASAPATQAGSTPVPAASAATTPTIIKPNEEKEDGDLGAMLKKPVESVDELKDIVRKGFIPKLVAAIVSFAIHQKASDVHIESFDDEVRVRFRIDGQLLDVVKLSPDVHAAMVSRIKILARMRLDESRVPQDGRFDVLFEHARVDLRVSVMPTVHGEKVVMRLLDKDKSMVSLDSLGVQGLAYRNLIDSVTKPYGICLATGPTGSGKSTTLYAILNRIATSNVNVITLEDPVEYEMKGINQVQVRPRIGFTFAEGLRAVLRQDPNVVMVGEIRDGETANMATQAALTGHLVLSSLHTNDAAGAIPRLTNMGIEPFLITSSLNCALGQRLVRRICPSCKREMMLPPSIKDKITADLEQIKKTNPLDAKRVPEKFSLYQGAGCKECGGTGYKGRLGIYEVLVMNEELEDLTLKRASGSDMQSAAAKSGMLSMYQDGLLKAVSGITTIDEVLRESTNK